MSAYVVNQEHISAMLQAATPRYPGDGHNYRWQGVSRSFGGHAQEIGQILLDENYRSVNYRYSEDDKPPRFVNHPARSCSAVELIKLIHCYQYQACESPDWEQTEAYAIAAYLEGAAVRKLPGYEDAMWEFDPGAVRVPPLPPPPPPKEHLTRTETIKRIRAALKEKTGKTWSVTGGRGTGSGWIRVEAPPRRRVKHETVGDPRDPEFLNRPWRERFREVPPTNGETVWNTPMAEAEELQRAFGLEENRAHNQGIQISPDDWEWYVERAEAA